MDFLKTRWTNFTDDHPRIADIVTTIQRALPPLNFITIHYVYFIAVPLITSLIFWGSSDPAFSISYVDSLFLTVSAMTEAGLNTVNLSQMTTWQQVLLWLLIILGSTIWVSIWTILARKHVFERRFRHIVKSERDRRARRRNSFSRPVTREKPEDAAPTAAGSIAQAEEGQGRGFHPSNANGDHVAFTETSRPKAGVTSAYQPPEGVLNRRQAQQNGGPDSLDSEESAKAWLKRIGKRGTVGRNSQFHDLSSEDRDRLGGCEYRALKLLGAVVPLYFFLWQFFSAIGIGAWIAANAPATATSNGSNPWWAGIFFAISAFNNNGMALLDANVIPFEQASYVLITMGLAILAGNTAYPLFLRLILWTGLKLLAWTCKEGEMHEWKETLEFILKHPRRVYTNLFPSRPTWWLLFMLILLNVIDWLAFEVLNIGNPIIDAIPRGSRVLDGLFQALAVRSGGFYVIPISRAYIGLQVLYVIMMYVSVYPVVITMRHSNVYEERSLGIYANDPDSESSGPDERTPGSPRPGRGRAATSALLGAVRHTFTLHGVGAAAPRPPDGAGEESRVGFISHQVRGQLAHDLWWLVLAVLAISTIETANFLADPAAYSVFNVIFEVVSAYGCVGISVGLPNAAFSFCGGWHAASKLVLCLVMLRGRHRGLPVALDRAVRLPGERLWEDEDEDYHIRRSMTRRVDPVD